MVSPHNAHGRLIVRNIAEWLSKGSQPRTTLSEEELMEMLSSTVYSVEKFQGSDRQFIIGTFGVSSVDQLRAEEDFLYDLSRFNVLISRAKHKMLLLCSQNYLNHVPHRREVMGVAKRVREYVYDICSETTIFSVPWANKEQAIELRWMPPTPKKTKPKRRIAMSMTFAAWRYAWPTYEGVPDVFR